VIRLVDVHHHVLPPFYMDAIRAAGYDRVGGIRFPEWRTEESLAVMDAHGIGAAVLSVSTPGVSFLDDFADGRRLARACNDWSAQLVAEHPGRFAALACLPLPDVEGARAEAARALDILGLDGVVLLASAGGRYLGDVAFEPLLEDLDRRRAVVLLHPTTPPGAPLPGLDVPVTTVEFMADTTRAIANLILTGTLERHPGLRFVCAHAGGFAPYITARLEAAWRRDPTGQKRAPAGPLAYLRRLHYDTAASANPYTLAALLALAGSDQVVLGTDFPFSPEADVRDAVAGLAAIPGLEATERARIGAGNILGLLPGLAARLEHC
jgi:predicted TIM-barrel fold metal-dependent hydrolase